MSLENLLDVHQVAAIMRIHHKKVQRLARTGVIPCIKVGAVYRFRATTLESWMETHEVSERIVEKETEEIWRQRVGVPVPRRQPGYSSEDLKGF